MRFEELRTYYYGTESHLLTTINCNNEFNTGSAFKDLRPKPLVTN